MTRSQNIESIENATKTPWAKWLSFLSGNQAESMPHGEIAILLEKELTKKVKSPQWWAQNITVAYEQHIGRRLPGQRSDGSFEISVSVTCEGQREKIADQLFHTLSNLQWINSSNVQSSRTSKTPVRSYWRCELSDQTKVTFAIEQAKPTKVLIVVTHSKMQGIDDAEKWRSFWRKYISDLI